MLRPHRCRVAGKSLASRGQVAAMLLPRRCMRRCPHRWFVLGQARKTTRSSPKCPLLLSADAPKSRALRIGHGRAPSTRVLQSAPGAPVRFCMYHFHFDHQSDPEPFACRPCAGHMALVWCTHAAQVPRMCRSRAHDLSACASRKFDRARPKLARCWPKTALRAHVPLFAHVGQTLPDIWHGLDLRRPKLIKSAPKLAKMRQQSWANTGRNVPNLTQIGQTRAKAGRPNLISTKQTSD